MWFYNINEVKPAVPNKFVHWMQKPLNLGDVLRRLYQNVKVSIINESFRDFQEEEYVLLTNKVRSKKCYVREIFLLGDNLPVCFAQVVVTERVFFIYEDALKNLGTRLIGETLLYNNPKTIRSIFSYAQIAKEHDYLVKIKNNLSDFVSPNYLPARRSIFKMNSIHPLLITEIFLPAIKPFPDY